jgi:MYXO-CTERM domain-containing protein
MPALLLTLLLATAPRAASLTGVVAEEDIHHGPRIPGASVWIDGVASTTSDSEGLYLFEGLASGSYTVHAVADGYLEGTCSKTIDESTLFWCSIALMVDPGGGDTGDTGSPDDTGDTGMPDDTGIPHDDTGAVDTAAVDTAPPGTFPPGVWTPLYGCHAARGAPGLLLGLLGLAGFFRRRTP